MKNCEQCGTEFSSKRESAKYCSPKCRVTASRKAGVVTDNVTLSDADVTLTFKFTIKRNKKDDRPNPVRTAKYWYDVPLAAIPVLQKGWPEVPIFETLDGTEPMNGRQYFLWWKNNFDMQENGTPIIHNPFPALDNVTYKMGGAASHMWGV